MAFPGGEDMLDAFTRLQMLQDTLAEQLEVRYHIHVTRKFQFYQFANGFEITKFLFMKLE